MADLLKSIKRGVKQYVQSTRTSDGRSALHLVVRANTATPIQSLLDAGLKRDMGDDAGNTPLHLAATEGAHIAIHTLLTYSPILSPVAMAPTFHNSSSSEESDIVGDPRATHDFDIAEFVDKRNNAGETALHLACQTDSLECIKVLLEFRSNLHAVTETGKQPIHYAVAKDSLESTQHLFSVDAKIVFTMTASESLLHLATSKPMVELLLSYGIDPAAKDSNGNTVLHSAVINKKFKLLLALLLSQVSANLTSCRGNTALHTAVTEHADTLYAKTMVVFGVDVAIKNDDGKTAYELALDRNNEEYVLLLSSAGAHDQDFMSRSNHSKKLKKRDKDTPRDRRNWSGRDGAVLCIDGGGIRGLISTQILLEIETRTRAAIVDLFDWISGSSTGALLAIALVYTDTTTRDMQSVYFDVKNTVFQGSRPYKSEVLEDAIKKVTGSVKMVDSRYPRTIVTTTIADVRPCRLHLFTNYTPETLNTPIWEAARASGAAPTYFSPFEEKYLDGGIMANNPTVQTLTEMRKYLNNSSDNEPCKPKIVISVGTGLTPTEHVDNIDIGYVPRNPLHAARYLSGAVEMMSTILEQTTSCDGPCVEHARYWCESVDAAYYRLQLPVEPFVALNEDNDIAVIQMCWDTCVYIYQKRDVFSEICNTLLEGAAA